MSGIFIFDIFMIYIIYLLSAKRRNYNKWRLELEKNGYKYDGVIKEIRLLSRNKYRVKVNYFSNLYQKDIVLEIPEVYFESLDTNKKIVCEVYESSKKDDKHDYDLDLFEIKDNSISLSANPIKLLKTVHKKYTDKNFGNAYAINFKYDTTN